MTRVFSIIKQWICPSSWSVQMVGSLPFMDLEGNNWRKNNSGNSPEPNALTFVGSCVWAHTSGERTCYWDAHSEESWELGDLVNHVTLLTPVWKNTGVITPTQVSLRQTQVSLLPVWYGWHLSKVTVCLQMLAFYSARQTEKCGCHKREAWGNIIYSLRINLFFWWTFILRQPPSMPHKAIVCLNANWCPFCDLTVVLWFSRYHSR
jgi:hypothetical protein